MALTFVVLGALTLQTVLPVALTFRSLLPKSQSQSQAPRGPWEENQEERTVESHAVPSGRLKRAVHAPRAATLVPRRALAVVSAISHTCEFSLPGERHGRNGCGAHLRC